MPCMPCHVMPVPCMRMYNASSLPPLPPVEKTRYYQHFVSSSSSPPFFASHHKPMLVFYSLFPHSFVRRFSFHIVIIVLTGPKSWSIVKDARLSSRSRCFRPSSLYPSMHETSRLLPSRLLKQPPGRTCTGSSVALASSSCSSYFYVMPQGKKRLAINQNA